LDAKLAQALDTVHGGDLLHAEVAGAGHFVAVADRFAAERLQPEHHVHIGTGTADGAGAADGVANAQDIDHLRPDAGFLQHLPRHGVGDDLVMLDITARNLPPAATRLVTAPDQECLAVADHDTAAADAEIAEEKIGAGRAGDAIPAAFQARAQFRGTHWAVLHEMSPDRAPGRHDAGPK